MGTRGLTAVILDGEHKIAQYGQWDHYPSGQGLTALEFCREVMVDDAKRDTFIANLRRCRFETPADEAERDAWLASIGVRGGTMNMAQYEQWKNRYTLHTRDHGAEILNLVANAEPDAQLVVQDSWDFGADSLFCEWAYVVDATAGTLEVYRGFNKRPATGRFAAMEPKRGDYTPITLAKTYRIAALPADADFVDELEKIADDLRGEEE